MWCFPIRQSVLHISQITKNCHGIRPPIFIQSWLQQYGWRSFFHSSYCSLGYSIGLGSMKRRRVVMPGYFCTRFSKFQKVVCVHCSWCLRLLEELFQTLFRPLWSFRFTRRRLNPLSGEILSHDSVSMIVSRFTFPFRNFPRPFGLACSPHRLRWCLALDLSNSNSGSPVVYLDPWPVDQCSFVAWVNRQVCVRPSFLVNIELFQFALKRFLQFSLSSTHSRHRQIPADVQL